MISKARVGAAMLNWRYVGKTFVYRDEVRQQILADGPNCKPFRYIEKNDICRWLKAPADATADGRVIWISKDGKMVKMSGVKQSLMNIPVEYRPEQQKDVKYRSFLKKIPIKDVTLLDTNGNPAESVEILYTKNGDPMRVTERGVAIPYQDEYWGEKKEDDESDTTNDSLQRYGKHIADLQDVDASIVASLGQDLELKLNESKVKGTFQKVKKWVTKENE